MFYEPGDVNKVAYDRTVGHLNVNPHISSGVAGVEAWRVEDGRMIRNCHSSDRMIVAGLQRWDVDPA